MGRTLPAAIVFGAGLAVTANAQAAEIETALSVVIDGSGSILGSDFTLQRNAYASVFNDPTVLVADGRVVVNVIQFSNGAQIEQTAIRINDEADRDTLVDAINAMSQLGSVTDVGGGIDLGVSDMDSFLAGIDAAEFSTDFEKIIDVSTDGFENAGSISGPDATADAVNNQGYAAVNCLGIGGGADCSFNDGFGFEVFVDSFDDLQPVLENKVRAELGTIDVPVPATFGLLAFGLFALGATAVGRRRA